MAKYLLTKQFHGHSTLVELSKSQFEEIESARQKHFHALFIEDQIGFVLQNFISLERTLLGLSLNSTLAIQTTWTDSVENIHSVNLCLSNLLSSIRTYLDTVKNLLCDIYGSGALQVKEFDDTRREVHSTSFGYRVCDELRNHAQHRGFPISSLGLNTAVVNDHIEHAIAINSSLDELENGGFKGKVLDELKPRYRGQFDVKPLIREAVVGIGRIHEVVRNSLSHDIPKWVQSIEAAIQKYQAVDDNVSGLVLMKADDNGVPIVSYAINRDPIERFEKLQKKFKYLTHFDSHYVSGAVLAGRK